MTEILAGPEAIAIGVDRLGRGLLVAFPTETVYGLGADALDGSAVERVFTLKGRSSTNPLIVHVAGIEMARSVVADWPEEADRIAKAHWPGPVTIVLPKGDRVPGIVCADGPTVAVRCPAHPCALALIESFARPIVGPSANPSGKISPTTPEHVADGFPDADLVIIDGGHCWAGIESTVVDLSDERVRVLRPGIIGAHAIADTIGRSVEFPDEPEAESLARSPGLVGPHYKPYTPTRLIDGDEIEKASPKVVLIAWSVEYHPSDGLLIPMPEPLEAYASQIYRALHDADRALGTEIWVERPPMGDAHADDRAIRSAIMERLRRATHA